MASINDVASAFEIYSNKDTTVNKRNIDDSFELTQDYVEQEPKNLRERIFRFLEVKQNHKASFYPPVRGYSREFSIQR